MPRDGEIWRKFSGNGWARRIGNADLCVLVYADHVEWSLADAFAGEDMQGDDAPTVDDAMEAAERAAEAFNAA